jgi:hypothetical protein
MMAMNAKRMAAVILRGFSIRALARAAKERPAMPVVFRATILERA